MICSSRLSSLIRTAEYHHMRSPFSQFFLFMYTCRARMMMNAIGGSWRGAHFNCVGCIWCMYSEAVWWFLGSVSICNCVYIYKSPIVWIECDAVHSDGIALFRLKWRWNIHSFITLQSGRNVHIMKDNLYTNSNRKNHNMNIWNSFNYSLWMGNMWFIVVINANPVDGTHHYTGCFCCCSCPDAVCVLHNWEKNLSNIQMVYHFIWRNDTTRHDTVSSIKIDWNYSVKNWLMIQPCHAVSTITVHRVLPHHAILLWNQLIISLITPQSS